MERPDNIVEDYQKNTQTVESCEKYSTHPATIRKYYYDKETSLKEELEYSS